MTIFETITADLRTARLARDSVKVTSLSTLLGEMTANAVMVEGAKVVDDQLAISILKKTAKGLTEILSHGANQAAADELDLVDTYLPSQLTVEGIRNLLVGAKADDVIHSLPEAMNYLKTNFAGLYDGKIASGIAKEIFG